MLNNYNIEYDEAKRAKTLEMRGIDFERAADVFSGVAMHQEDTRFDYGETRIITVGPLDDRLVVMVWTWRNDNRRIISMRYANERERRHYQAILG